MSLKSSLPALVLVSAVILLLASTAESCVNFQAWWSPPGGSNLWNAQLWDDSTGPQCQISDLYFDQTIPNNVANINCNDGYEASWSWQNFDKEVGYQWDLEYSTPNGYFAMATPWDPTVSMYYGCQFCDNPGSCFVPT